MNSHFEKKLISRVASFLFTESDQPLRPSLKLSRAGLLFGLLAASIICVSVLLQTPQTPSLLVLTLLGVGILLAILHHLRAWTSLRLTARHAQQMTQNLETSLALHEEMFEHNGAATLYCEPDGRILRCNLRAATMIGLPPVAIENRLLQSLLQPLSDQSRPATSSNLVKTSLSGVWNLAAPGSKPRTIGLTQSIVKTSGNIIVSLSDITGIREMREALLASQQRESHLSHYDLLTDLPNRTYLIELLEQKVRDATNEDHAVAVISIKARNVQIVNKRFGISAGDDLLRFLATRIQNNLLPGDLLGRTRGETFTLAISSPAERETATQRVAEYIANLPKQYIIEDITLDLDFFIGTAIYPFDARNSDDLLRYSHFALSTACHELSSLPVYYNPQLDLQTRRKIDLEVGLRTALRERSLHLVYQPKVSADGAIAGLEALVRWHSPVLGHVSPAEFIPLAEESGLIHHVTLFVIESVIDQIRLWQENQKTVCPVAVNLSAIDLSRPELVNEIVSRTYLLDVPAELLEFEITETALMINGETGMDNLHQLREKGYRISIDDFGSGYSSLSKMANLPIYAIKIDREFVNGIPGDVRKEKIVHGILSLAQSLGLTVVAEGVEEAAQLEFLRQRGCQTFQGYYFHRPLDSGRTGSLLEISAEPATA